MKHARKDYERIQDPEGIIPADEPVFLIRGKDIAAPAAVEAWAALAEASGASEAIVETARAHARAMRVYQEQFGKQVPDMPLDA
jgi:hypothetical protein